MKTHAIATNDGCPTKQSSTRMSSAGQLLEHFFELAGCPKKWKNWVWGRTAHWWVETVQWWPKTVHSKPSKLTPDWKKVEKHQTKGPKPCGRLFRWFFFLLCGQTGSPTFYLQRILLYHAPKAMSSPGLPFLKRIWQIWAPFCWDFQQPTTPGIGYAILERSIIP